MSLNLNLKKNTEDFYQVDHHLYAAYLSLIEANKHIFQKEVVLNQKAHELNADILATAEKITEYVKLLHKECAME